MNLSDLIYSKINQRIIICGAHESLEKFISKLKIQCQLNNIMIKFVYYYFLGTFNWKL